MDNRSIEDLTLKDLLAVNADDVPNPAVEVGVQSEEFRTLYKKISAQPLPIAWDHAQSEIAGMFSAALNTSVLDLWAHGWEKYRELMDDVERSRKSPSAVVITRLAEHSIESTLHPYLEIFLGPQRIQKIPFDVTLTTKIDGLELSLKKGQITALQVGEVEWTGTVRVKEATLVQRQLTKLSLPGRVELKRPISLGSA
jgi:hypothetical protein